MRQVSKRRDFVIDVVEIAVYLGEQNDEMISERFVDAVEETVADIADMPGFGTLRDFGSPDFSGLRSRQVQGYRSYLIFYLHSDASIEFVRVLHGARDLESIFGD